MALYHQATLTPSKAELLAAWVPTQRWCPLSDDPLNVVGAYRFDDPEGQVGLEAFLVSRGDTVFHVPLTYRDRPVEDAEGALVGEIHHSALGNRWVYDGVQDQRFRVMLAGVALTGQGAALGLVLHQGQWHIAPTHVRLHGGGWTQERACVDGLELVSAADAAGAPAVLRSDRFELMVHRRAAEGPQPPIGLTATWQDQPKPVVLAEIRER